MCVFQIVLHSDVCMLSRYLPLAVLIPSVTSFHELLIHEYLHRNSLVFPLDILRKRAFNKRKHIHCEDWLQPSSCIKLREVSLNLVADKVYYIYICLTTCVFLKSSSAQVNRAKYTVKPVDRNKCEVHRSCPCLPSHVSFCVSPTDTVPVVFAFQ